jgi:hypothetical protein
MKRSFLLLKCLALEVVLTVPSIPIYYYVYVWYPRTNHPNLLLSKKDSNIKYVYAVLGLIYTEILKKSIKKIVEIFFLKKLNFMYKTRHDCSRPVLFLKQYPNEIAASVL